jgi:hypothetical protein
VRSFFRREAKPGKSEFPPARTTFSYSTLKKQIKHEDEMKQRKERKTEKHKRKQTVPLALRADNLRSNRPATETDPSNA